jgi:hypothetical protein
MLILLSSHTDMKLQWRPAGIENLGIDCKYREGFHQMLDNTSVLVTFVEVN